MGLTLEPLSSNLQEMYSVAHATPEENTSLVANLSGTCLYNDRKGWGNLLRWVWYIVSIFVGDSCKNRKLKEAILKTHAEFQAQLPNLNLNLQTYQSYIDNLANGYDLYDVDEARNAITAWNDATLPFLKLVRKKQGRILSSIFQRCWGEDPSTSDPKELFKTDLFSQCVQYQNIIDLEGVCELPIPFETLGRLSSGKKLFAEHKKEIRKWIKKVNTQSSLNVRLIHKALKVIVDNVEASARSPGQKSSSRLELELVNLGCGLFTKRDPIHLRWRDRLRPGDTVMCNGRPIVLGEQIGKKLDVMDRNVIFNVEGDPDSVLWISVNEAIIGIKQRLRNEYNGVLRVVEFKEIDENGRCAILEKLQRPISRRKWSSASKLLSSKDQRGCQRFIDLIKTLLQTNHTPSPFAPEHLRLDRNLNISIIKVPKNGPLNFNALVDFALAVSNRNAAVFHYITTTSGLVSHRYARFYITMATNALSGNHEQASEVAKLMGSGIGDISIVNRGQALHDALAAMKTRCCEKLHARYNVDIEPSIESTVQTALMSGYMLSGGCGIIWPTLEDEAFDKICQQLHLPPPPSQSPQPSGDNT